MKSMTIPERRSPCSSTLLAMVATAIIGAVISTGCVKYAQVKPDPASEARQLIAEAQRAEQSAQPEEARRLYQASLDKSELPAAKMGLARYYFDQGDYARAAAYLSDLKESGYISRELVILQAQAESKTVSTQVVAPDSLPASPETAPGKIEATQVVTPVADSPMPPAKVAETAPAPESSKMSDSDKIESGTGESEQTADTLSPMPPPASVSVETVEPTEAISPTEEPSSEMVAMASGDEPEAITNKALEPEGAPVATPLLEEEPSILAPEPADAVTVVEIEDAETMAASNAVLEFSPEASDDAGSPPATNFYNELESSEEEGPEIPRGTVLGTAEGRPVYLEEDPLINSRRTLAKVLLEQETEKVPEEIPARNKIEEVMFSTASAPLEERALSSETALVSDPQFYLRRGRQALTEGNLVRARAQFMEALSVEPNNLEALIELADVYEQMGRSEQARNLLNQAEKVAPRNPRVYYKTGNSYLRRGRPADAIRYYEEALKLNPSYTYALHNAGVASMQQEQWSTARDYLQRTIQVDSSYAPAYRNLGILAEKQANDPRAAIRYYTRYIELGGVEADVVQGWIAELKAQRPGNAIDE